MSGVNEIRLRVRYAETDQMGVVYHANYLVWMEMGRVELCRTLGVRYRDLEVQEGVLLTVAEATCRYHAPARYDDEVTVETSVKRSTSRLIEFEYRIMASETGAKLATGSTTHVFCNRELRPCRLPRKYWPAFGVPASGSLQT
jgi:acyl-CoA thioester hydrolase